MISIEIDPKSAPHPPSKRLYTGVVDPPLFQRLYPLCCYPQVLVTPGCC